MLENYHKRFTVRLGMPKAELGSRLKLGRYSPAIWQRLSSEGVLSEDLAKKINFQVDEEIEKAVKFAEESPYPSPENALEDLFFEEEMV